MSKGRYTCQLGINTQFGGGYNLYIFDNLSLINPQLGYATNNIKKWFIHRVLGYTFFQDELDEIFYDEDGNLLEIPKASKALIEAFKYINVMFRPYV